jgi:predicted nucleic acid-binding protein
MPRRTEQRTFFLDTSALAKLYMREPGSRKLARWVGERTVGFFPFVRLYVSRMVIPEAMSAITRRRNERKVESRGALWLWNSVLSDFVGRSTPFLIVEPTEDIVIRAALLVAAHGLRGYDAVQLASALSVQARLGDPAALVFVCSDGDLSKAAKAAGLTTADPAT